MSQIKSHPMHWIGELEFGAMKITLALNITKNQNRCHATLNCLEQGIIEMPVDSIILSDVSLTFAVHKLNASFTGFLNKEKNEFSGTFIQNNISLPLILKHSTQIITRPNRPQEPKSPYPYDVHEVSYDNKNAGIILSGTLTVPRTKLPFPVVLLIAGSGANDRDETCFGHKPFFVIADYLTRQGIAVLRVDKRGVGKSTGNYATATTRDFADDVLTGVEFLKNHPDINFKQIGLIGHSEGGVIASMAAAESKDVAFIIMLAGPGVTGKEILQQQWQLMARAQGTSEELISRDLILRQQLFTIMEEEADSAKAKLRMLEVAEKYLSELPEHAKTSERSPEAIYGFIENDISPWMRYFLLHDPATNLKKIKIPMLVLNGELDMQVLPSQNLTAIAAALKEAGNKNYTIFKLPKINHLFQQCQTGSVNEYAMIEETICPSVLDIMSKWITTKIISNNFDAQNNEKK